jgi:hypothetical protein
LPVLGILRSSVGHRAPPKLKLWTPTANVNSKKT